MEHLVRAAKGFTGAQIEELANTIYLLAVDGNSCHNGTGEACERVAVTGELIDTALEEVRVEEGRKAGFEGGL